MKSKNKPVIFYDDGYDDNFSTSVTTYIVNGRECTEAEYAEIARKKYIKHPPQGYTVSEIRKMSINDILDMDYFLNE